MAEYKREISWVGRQVLEVAARHQPEMVLWKLAAMRDRHLTGCHRLKYIRGGIGTVVKALIKRGFLEGDERLSKITPAGKAALVAFEKTDGVIMSVRPHERLFSCLDCGRVFSTNANDALRAAFSCKRCGSRRLDCGSGTPLPADYKDNFVVAKTLHGTKRIGNRPRWKQNADNPTLSADQGE